MHITKTNIIKIYFLTDKKVPESGIDLSTSLNKSYGSLPRQTKPAEATMATTPLEVVESGITTLQREHRALTRSGNVHYENIDAIIAHNMSITPVACRLGSKSESDRESDHNNHESGHDESEPGYYNHTMSESGHDESEPGYYNHTMSESGHDESEPGYYNHTMSESGHDEREPGYYYHTMSENGYKNHDESESGYINYQEEHTYEAIPE